MAALFDKSEFKTAPTKRRKLMHVMDAGPAEDAGNMVVMQCNRCDLKTDWFYMRTVTEAKRGIPCPKCNGVEFETDDDGDYLVGEIND